MGRLEFGWWHAPQRRSSTRGAVIVSLAVALTATHLDIGPAAGQSSDAEPSTAPTPPSPSPTTAGPVPGERELPELRTRTSATYARPDGSYRAEISTGSLHYRDGGGAWQRIDDGLVASDKPGVAARNKANRFSAEFPTDITTGEVRVAVGAASAAFAAEGLASAPAQVSGNAVRYAGVRPGVDLLYEVGHDAVKESFVLASPEATSTFSFRMRTAGGLTAAVRGKGLDLRDGAGVSQLRVNPPDLVDAAGKRGPVRLDAQPGPGGMRLTLTGDRAWLEAPGRAWPVVLDPTTTVGMQADCSIYYTWPNDPCWDTTAVPFGTQTNNEPIRALLKADLSAIPKDAVVTSAKLAAYVEMVGFVDTVKLQALTTAWDTSANWYNPCPATCANWSTAGGDVSADADYTTPGYSVPGFDSARWVEWYITQLVQDWVHPTAPAGTGIANHGVLIRRADETAYGQDYLVASNSTDTAKRPTFSVTYTRRTGVRPSAKFDTRQLSDRHSASVNLATGNLVARAADVAIKGTGVDLAVERYYNSLGAAAGTGWSFSVGQWVYADTQPDGSVVLREPGGADHAYIKKTTTPTFTTPPGANADLTKSGSTYTLTRHQSGEVFKFGTVANSISGSKAYLSSIADRNGNTITFAYNTAKQVTSLTDTQGRTATFAYTSGLLTSISDWSGRTWSYAWTASNLTSFTDPSTKVTSYGYDASGRLNQITTPSGIAGGTITKLVYNTDGSVQKLSRVKDTGGGTFDWTYAYSSTAQTGGTRCTAYGGSAPATMLGCTTVTDPRAFATSHGWDEADQVVKAIDSAGNVRSSKYGPNENVVEYTDSLSAVSTLSYDAANPANLTKVLTPSSNGTNTAATTHFSYNAPNPNNGSSLYKYLPSSTTDPQERCTAFGYDATGNAKTVTPGLTPSVGATPQCDTPPSGSAAYTYAYQGDTGVSCNAKARQLCKATDPKGNVTTYGYDGTTTGNLTSVTPPAPLGATAITVDSLSRVASVTDGKGQKTSYTYDKLDRVTRVTFNADTACASRSTCFDFTYDGNGNLTSRISNIGTTTFTYDQLNQVTKKVLPGPLVDACSGQTGMTFTYDSVGNLSTMCDAGGTVSYRYNGNNELTSIQEPGGNCAVSPVTGPCTVIGYTDAAGVYQDGRRTSVTFPPTTGTVMKMTYDGAGALSSIVGTKGATTLSSFAYTYAVGTKDTQLRRSVTTPSGTTSYGYDGLNRLCYEYAGATTAACGAAPGGASTWAYDPAGNRTTQVAGGVTTSYAYNAANQLCATSTSGTPSCSAPTYSYDANGNQTVAPGVSALAYNPLDQNTSRTVSGATTSYSYADMDQTERVSAAGTNLASSILGLSATSAGTYYTRDNAGGLVGQRISGANYYFLVDGLGSVAKIIDGSGNVVRTYTYDAWGKTTVGAGSVDSAFRYAGGYFDAAGGLYKFGARYYDPTIGRWTQEDPLPGHALQPNTLNRYTYAGCDPVNNLDRSGLSFNRDLAAYSSACAKGAVFGGAMSAVIGGAAAGIVGVLVGCVTGVTSKYIRTRHGNLSADIYDAVTTFVSGIF